MPTRFCILAITTLLNVASATADVDAWAARNTEIKTLFEAGEYQKVTKLAKIALDKAIEEFGYDSHRAAINETALGTIYTAQGMYTLALPYVEHALQLHEANGNLEEAAGTMNNLATIYESLGVYDDAEAMLKRVIKVNTQIHGENSIPVAHNLHTLAGLYSTMLRVKEAAPLYEKAMEILKSIRGNLHPDIAYIWLGVGTLYEQLSKLGMAKSHYFNALDIMTKTLGREHPSTGSVYVRLGNVAKKQGFLLEAREHYQRSLRIYAKSLGEEHEVTQRVREKLRDID